MDDFTPVDSQSLYFRALSAARLSATVLLLIAGVSFWIQWSTIPRFVEVFEHTVSGGRPALPNLTRMIIGGHTPLAGIGAFICLSALIYVWALGRDIVRVIFVATAGTALLLIASLVIHFALTQPLYTVVTKFAD